LRLKINKTYRKRREYLKDKINELETNSNNKIYLYRCINGFKEDYKPTINLEEYEKGDLLAYSHRILDSWKNCYW
jgi:hypothetical protein